eukprot:1128002-Prymnesium_polylepis.1
MPEVVLPPAAPLRLEDGQLLLVVSDGGRARCNGSASKMQFGRIQESQIKTVGGTGTRSIAFDECSNEALPWRPPAAGWDAAIWSAVVALRELKLREVPPLCGDSQRLGAAGAKLDLSSPKAPTAAEAKAIEARAHDINLK